MAQKLFVSGNEAVGWGALQAGCQAFFGYPITPQNETLEWFAREFPKRGKVFRQSQSESGSIYMLMGAGATGVRAMTSTASAGWSLMQDGMSCMAIAEVPAVVAMVQRGGPGMGHVRVAQSDYRPITKGGGNGGYRNIVLGPSSVQETHDLVQLAFHLADKYRNPVIVMSDAIVGQVAGTLEVKTIDFGPLPGKELWAVSGKGKHADGIRRVMVCSNPGPGVVFKAPGVTSNRDYVQNWTALTDKYNQMVKEEVRYETSNLDDAELVLVAYGYTAGVCRHAMNVARAKGMKVGFFRPISLWPFPTKAVREANRPGRKFLVVEDSFGQLVEDVEVALQGQGEAILLGGWARHTGDDGGKIFPERVLKEIENILVKDKTHAAR